MQYISVPLSCFPPLSPHTQHIHTHTHTHTHTQVSYPEDDAHAADGITPAIKAARGVSQFCRKYMTKIEQRLEYDGPTECTVLFTPTEILRGATEDLLRGVDAE